MDKNFYKLIRIFAFFPFCGMLIPYGILFMDGLKYNIPLWHLLIFAFSVSIIIGSLLIQFMHIKNKPAETADAEVAGNTRTR